MYIYLHMHTQRHGAHAAQRPPGHPPGKQLKDPDMKSNRHEPSNFHIRALGSHSHQEGVRCGKDFKDKIASNNERWARGVLFKRRADKPRIYEDEK